METETYNKAADILKTMGHPVRLKIIEGLIKENESCVKNIWTRLNLPQATVSQHLALLKNKKILKSTRKGVTMCYKIDNQAVIEIMKVINTGRI